jgi:hypothetical protein
MSFQRKKQNKLIKSGYQFRICTRRLSLRACGQGLGYATMSSVAIRSRLGVCYDELRRNLMGDCCVLLGGDS